LLRQATFLHRELIHALGDAAGIDAAIAVKVGFWLLLKARHALLVGPAWTGKIVVVLVSILVQAALATIFLLLSVLGKGTNVEDVYLILLDTQILIYFIPYIYLFVVFLIHRRRGESSNEVVLAPGGLIGGWLTGLSGMLVTLFAMIIATIPPPDMGNPLLFRLKVIGGALGFIVIGGLIYWRARFKRSERIEAEL